LIWFAMDCRKFHKNLEDYLQDGLDFSGRFGMERHAQQCISCGKDLSNAQRLRRMVHQLDRVKAPPDFDLSVLNKIAKRKANGWFSGIRRFWFYRFELASTRGLILASSATAVLAVGIFYLYPLLPSRTEFRPPSDPPLTVQRPVKVDRSENPRPAITAAVARPSRPIPSQARKSVKATESRPPEQEQMAEQEFTDTDYVEFQMVGPDNLPVTVRWPNRPHAKYGQTAQEYFIRNISH